MISLARLTLRREWRRFLPAVLAIAFSGLLMLIQLGLLIGMFGTFSTVITASSGDLWVGYPGTPCLDFARDFDRKNEVFLRAHSGVSAVEPFRWAECDIRRADGSGIAGVVVGVDVRPVSMLLQRNIAPDRRHLLDEPDAVFVDASTSGNLGLRVGDSFEVNGRRVRLAGFTSGLGTIGQMYVICSLETARSLAAATRVEDQVSYFLVKLRDPQRAVAIRDELQPRGPHRPYEVWTAGEFARQSQLYWLMESGAGNGFVFSTVLALIVGIVITAQTIRGVILGSLRELATLQALGVPLAALRSVVLEQTAWIGLAGLLLTVGITAIVQVAARWQALLFDAQLWSYGLAVAFVGVIVGCSALSAARTLARVDAATLLR
jgi:putative ABC transport system permease protein